MFITDIKCDPIKTPGHEPSVFQNGNNKNNMLVSPPTKPHVHEGPASKV